MQPGKVPPDVLSRNVFPYLGKHSNDVILGPTIGEDASAIRVGNRIIVVATDPITGSIQDIGWLAVHINANDVATFGVRPSWFLVSILLPLGSQEVDLERIMKQIHEAALSLNITVVGGHTEVTNGIEKPVVTGFMMGVTSEGNYATSSGARPGNIIIMTKTAAIEGTAILATEGEHYLSNHMKQEQIREAQSLRSRISVVEDGVVAFETGYITAMHDPTEGGLLGGLHEICDASHVGFTIDLDAIPIHDATAAICEVLDVDVLHLISSGCMLMTCAIEGADKVTEALNAKGIQATILGRITTDATIRSGSRNGKSTQTTRPQTDEIWAALKRLNQT